MEFGLARGCLKMLKLKRAVDWFLKSDLRKRSGELSVQEGGKAIVTQLQQGIVQGV